MGQNVSELFQQGKCAELSALRNETDLYGFSHWLAEELGFPFPPLSLRGYQHGWIWWEKCKDEPFGLGLDPNLNKYWGEIVQDENVRSRLQEEKIFSVVGGLPFVHFYKNFQMHELLPERISGSVLYIPTHSNPWGNYQRAIEKNMTNLRRVVGGNLSIMLAWNDRGLSHRVREAFDRVEVGAGALEITSFFRLMRIFHRYESVITDSMGSHILYATICGCKVGLHAELVANARENAKSMDTIDNKRDTAIGEWSERIHDPSLIDSLYPGLVIDSQEIGGFCAPNFQTMASSELAKALGWGLSLECELASRGYFERSSTTGTTNFA